MITKLRLSYQGVTVDFAIHEVIEIARQLLPGLNNEEIPIQSIRSYFDKLQESLEDLRKSDKNPLDLLPIASKIPMIPPLVRPAQWRYVAKFIASPDQREGYWLNIAGRMLRVDKKDNYVSDYGPGFSGINATSRLIFSNPTVPFSVFEKLEQTYRSTLENVQLQGDKSNITEGIKLPEMGEEEDQYFFLLIMDKLSRMLSTLEGNYETKKKLDQMSPKYEQVMKVIKSLGEQYRLQKQKSSVMNLLNDTLHKVNPENTLPPLSSFLDGLSKKSEQHKTFVDILRNLMVSIFNLTQIAKGDSVPVFRINTFGDESGPTYQQFEDLMKRALKQFTSREIASFIRGILVGKCDDRLPVFLPALATAWFVSEASRDALAELTNLIVMDFVEGDIIYMEESRNLYTWTSLLLNPYAGVRGKKIPDLYGFKLKPHEKGGMYPAAHDGSYHDSAKEKHDDNNHLVPNLPLNWLRQKQGHLILHWLYLMIYQHCPIVKAEIVMGDLKSEKNNAIYSQVIKSSKKKNSTVALDKADKNVYHSKVALRKKEKDQSIQLRDYTTFWNKNLVPLRHLETKAILQTQLLEPLLASRINSFDFGFSPHFMVESATSILSDFKVKPYSPESSEWYTEDKIMDILLVRLGDKVVHVAQTQLEHTALLKENLTQAIGEVIIQNKPAVIPVHLHDNHWAALVIKKLEDESLQVIFNDSKGNKLEDEQNALTVVTVITEINPNASIIDLRVCQQFNDNDCGPFATDNMIRIATADTSNLEREAIAALLEQPMFGSAANIRQEQTKLLVDGVRHNIETNLVTL